GTAATSPYSKGSASCRDSALDTNDRSQLSATVVTATPGNVYRGHVFANGVPARNGFNTALPPNSPSCSNRNQPTIHQGWGAFSATSYHTGGVNAALLDGSVRFISEGIHCGDFKVTVDKLETVVPPLPDVMPTSESELTKLYNKREEETKEYRLVDIRFTQAESTPFSINVNKKMGVISLDLSTANN
ncbi:MAG: DUF1559 domain-containing protein, partial [Planctomycetaceae bacterium]|nr:DUF1559 domain-containing protein [Planctomycetaceae bacterium]